MPAVADVIACCTRHATGAISGEVCCKPAADAHAWEQADEKLLVDALALAQKMERLTAFDDQKGFLHALAWDVATIARVLAIARARGVPDARWLRAVALHIKLDFHLRYGHVINLPTVDSDTRDAMDQLAMLLARE